MKKNDKNAAQRSYWADAERIAELLNVLLFESQRVILAADIADAGTEFILNVEGKQDLTSVYRTSDVAKRVKIGDSQFYLYLENQTDIDYAMPERTLVLEAACYHEQRNRIKKSHVKKKDWISSAEFLSGFCKSDKLMPAICIVLYYGEKPWDAARSTQEMFHLPDDRPMIKNYVNNSRFLLVDVRRFEKAKQFRTDLRYTFTFIKISSDKEKLLGYLTKYEEVLQEMQDDAYDFMAYTTGSKELMRKKEKGEGKINMCRAIRELMEDSREEGRLEGKLEGKIEGREIGEAMITQLMQCLIADDRVDDLIRSASDQALQRRLLAEYAIGV